MNRGVTSNKLPLYLLENGDHALRNPYEEVCYATYNWVKHTRDAGDVKLHGGEKIKWIIFQRAFENNREICTRRFSEK